VQNIGASVDMCALGVMLHERQRGSHDSRRRYNSRQREQP
jgi:hypothetical protein